MVLKRENQINKQTQIVFEPLKSIFTKLAKFSLVITSLETIVIPIKLNVEFN